MATLVPPPSKRQRKLAQEPKQANIIPEDLPFVQIQFKAADTGAVTNGFHRVPGGSTVKQLELLLNGLLGTSSEAVPYTFSLQKDSAGSVDVTSDLYSDVLQKGHKTTEDVLTLVYTPQAIFKVKSVSRCSATISGHGGTILAAQFAPGSSKYLLTGSGDMTARIWDTEMGTPHRTLKGHTNWVLCVAWSPDGSLIATGSMDNTVRLWDPESGKQLGNGLAGHNKFVTALSFEPLHLRTADDPIRLCSSSKDGTVKIWNANTRTSECSLSGHTASVTGVKWGGKGWIYSISQDKTVRVWDAKARRLLYSLNAHAHWVNHISLSTEYVLRTGGFDPEKAFYSPQGRSSETLATLLAQAQARFDKAAASTTAEPHERFVTASDDMTMFLWDLSVSTSKPVARMTGHQKPVNYVSFSPDGRYIASCSFDNSIKLWDGRDGKFVDTMRGHVAAVYMCAWSSDSRLLVSCSKDMTVKVWDVRTRKLFTDLPGHKGEVYAVDWSVDGKVVGSGGKDKAVKLWKH
ncbi:WD40-repeat-containing domain protein [Dipodascopsis tothii]|uniref:WD40-repeat-containing domain protein n=1 Tax=Dipodascopsis tothii TaxID=44089 RepID=UPI0034CDE7C7